MHVADMLALRVGGFDSGWRFELYQYLVHRSMGMLKFRFLMRGWIQKIGLRVKQQI